MEANLEYSDTFQGWGLIGSKKAHQKPNGGPPQTKFWSE